MANTSLDGMNLDASPGAMQLYVFLDVMSPRGSEYTARIDRILSSTPSFDESAIGTDE